MSIGAILGGVGSLINAGAGIAGMFGKKEDNYHPEVWRNDATKNYMQQVRTIKAAADEYGFHPLALLGANVSSGGFAQPVGGSSSSFLGDALAGVGNMFGDIGSLYESDQDRRERAQDRLDRLDENAKQRQERSLDRIRQENAERKQQGLVDAQTRNVDADTMLKLQQSRTEAAQLRALMRGGVTGGKVMVSPDGSEFKVGPGSSAQEWEDQYGDPVGWFYGTGSYIRDLVENTPLLKALMDYRGVLDWPVPPGGGTATYPTKSWKGRLSH